MVNECAVCGQLCSNSPTWTPEQELEEAKKNFGSELGEEEDQVKICDDCYNDLFKQEIPKWKQERVAKKLKDLGL